MLLSTMDEYSEEDMESFFTFVHGHSLLISSLILIIAYIFIAIEKIPKVTVALFGAAITLIIGLLSNFQKENGVFAKEYFINYIDFNVIFLLVSMMIIVGIAAKSGVFDWLALQMLKITKGEPKVVMLSLAVFTAITSAFLDNVTTVILIMPITFVIAMELNVSVIPYLIVEIISSNIGGTATLIGDPPNIIIGSIANLSFLDFVSELTGIVFIIFIVCIGLLIFIFRKELVTTKEKMKQISELDTSNTIKDKPLMIRSLIVLGLVIVGFVMHGSLHIPASTIAMVGATFLLLFENPNEIFNKIEWNTILFFIGLFIIIGGFEAAGGIGLMAKWLLDITNGSQTATAMIIVWASGILSGFIDNIPYTATMAPMILNIQNIMGVQYAHPLWWSLSLGACLGGNMTIIGAAANVIVSETAAKRGYALKFMEYIKYGVLTTFVSLTISNIYIYFRFLR